MINDSNFVKRQINVFDPMSGHPLRMFSYNFIDNNICIPLFSLYTFYSSVVIVYTFIFPCIIIIIFPNTDKLQHRSIFSCYAKILHLTIVEHERMMTLFL